MVLEGKISQLRMDEGMKVLDYLSTLNGIISELEAIWVKVVDEIWCYLVSLIFL